MPSPSTLAATDPYIDTIDDDNVAKWSPAEATMLSSLIAMADKDRDLYEDDGSKVPWRVGHALKVAATGGLYDRQRRHVMIAADRYSGYRAKNSAVNVTEDCNLQVDGNITMVVRQNLPASASTSSSSASSSASGSSSSSGSSPLDGLEGVAWGQHRLAVTGNATYRANDRTTLLSGLHTRYERVWNGSIMRIAGMEGVICAGFYLRTIMPISATISALVSGDVYGVSGRASLVRVNLAGMGYRSVEACAWAIGFYYRSTAFTIEPIIGTPTQHQPTKNILRKIGRLMLALCPFLDLLAGLAAFFIGGPYNLIKGGINKLRGKKKTPQAGPPRVRVRNVGVCSQGRNISMIT